MTVRTAAFAQAHADSEPLSALNITPLIDVLLVLIVMLILTIPIVTHEVPVTLPTAGGKSIAQTVHRVAIRADGSLTWDGRTIAEAALPAYLAALDATTQLEIAPEPTARYDRFAHVIADIKRAGVTRLGFVGNERFRDY